MKTNRYRLLYIGGMTFLTTAEIRSNSLKSKGLYHLQTGVSESAGGLQLLVALFCDEVYPSDLSNKLSLMMECLREKCGRIIRTALYLKSFVFADSENPGHIPKCINILMQELICYSLTRQSPKETSYENPPKYDLVPFYRAQPPNSW